MLGAVLVLSALLFLSLVTIAALLPSWLQERRRRRSSDAAADRLRQRVREVRAEADAAKDALARCEAAVAQVAAAARKTGDTLAPQAE